MTTNTIVCLGLMILFGIGFFTGLFFGIGEGLKACGKKKKISKYAKCDCKDVNQCSKWCNAKHLFKKTLTVDSYSITGVCPHDMVEIKIIASIVTCETTQLVCSDCGEPLEPPKTEC